MLLKQKIISELKKIKLLSKKNKKKTAFVIGNTAKFEKRGYYFTPIRVTEKLVSFVPLPSLREQKEQVTDPNSLVHVNGCSQ